MYSFKTRYFNIATFQEQVNEATMTSGDSGPSIHLRVRVEVSKALEKITRSSFYEMTIMA